MMFHDMFGREHPRTPSSQEKEEEVVNCDNKQHVWSKWERSRIYIGRDTEGTLSNFFQSRHCLACGFIQEERL